MTKPLAPFTITYNTGTFEQTDGAGLPRLTMSTVSRTTIEKESFLQVQLTLPVALVRTMTRKMMAQLCFIVEGVAKRELGCNTTVRASFNHIETMTASCEYMYFTPCEVQYTLDDDREVCDEPLGVAHPQPKWDKYLKDVAQDALRSMLSQPVFFSFFREIDGGHASVPLKVQAR